MTKEKRLLIFIILLVIMTLITINTKVYANTVKTINTIKIATGEIEPDDFEPSSPQQ